MQERNFLDCLHHESSRFNTFIAIFIQCEAFRFPGLLPTLVAIFPNSSLQFGFYHLFGDIWRHYFAEDVRILFCSYHLASVAG